MCSIVLSSPEHMIRMSYCDHPLPGGVRQRSSNYSSSKTTGQDLTKLNYTKDMTSCFDVLKEMFARGVAFFKYMTI